MRIIKDGSVYKVESNTKGNFWRVDLSKNTCTCPHFKFRLRKTKADCKHIAATKEYVSQSTAPIYDQVVSYVKANVFVDSVELIEQYEEDIINGMIEKGYLIEENGQIRLL